MTTKNKPSLGIKRVASIHMFVRDLERSRDYYVERLGLAEIARSTPEFEQEQRARGCVVEAGGARFVLIEPLGSRGESYQWLRKHPEGVGRLVFDVEDAERTFQLLGERGATAVTGIERRSVEGGTVIWFDIASALGDTLFRFVQHAGNTPILPDMCRLDPPRGGTQDFVYGDVDHITSNFITLKPAIMWMEEVMGFERLWEIEFHTEDVKRGRVDGTGLKSIVMWDPVSQIKFANNEPLAPNFKASQTYLFCEDHKGVGVQHIALSVDNLIAAVRSTREMGAQFMQTPTTYYDSLLERVGQIDEDLATLRDLEILVDGQADGAYLLQIFMKEAGAIFGEAEAGPFFIELIQRKGDLGFGGGNFRALFNSIEQQQQIDGRA